MKCQMLNEIAMNNQQRHSSILSSNIQLTKNQTSYNCRNGCKKIYTHYSVFVFAFSWTLSFVSFLFFCLYFFHLSLTNWHCITCINCTISFSVNAINLVACEHTLSIILFFSLQHNPKQLSHDYFQQIIFFSIFIQYP